MADCVEDFSKRVPHICKLYKSHVHANCEDDLGQMAVVSSIESVTDGIVVVVGLAGTSKTKSLEQLPPRDYASAYNEFSEYTKMSVLANFEDKE